MSATTHPNTITSPAAATRKMVHQQFSILRHKRQLLTILSLLFICVIGWAVVSLFASQQKSKVSTELTKLAQPLIPNLDIEILNLLENKRSFTDEELADFPIYRVYVDPRTREEQIVPIGEPLPTTTPVPTPRPAATAVPQAQ